MAQIYIFLFIVPKKLSIKRKTPNQIPKGQIGSRIARCELGFKNNTRIQRGYAICILFSDPAQSYEIREEKAN